MQNSNCKRVFISGGAGFLGSHFVRRLLSRPETERIVIYDNFSSGQESYLTDVRKDSRLVVVRADLKDKDAVIEAMKGCDTVIHLAANPDIAKATTQPDIDFWEGTYLAQNVFEAMRITNTKRILYTSGSGVYGEDATTEFKENYGPCLPISTYGASKLACEALLCAYCHMFGFRARAFRFANVVGPRQTHGVGYDFVRRLRADPQRLRILGNGLQSKSYIHADDIMDAVFTVDAAAGEGYDIFNVATGDYITVREIADLAVEVCGLRPGHVQYDFTGGDRGWKGDVPIVRFNCDKIKSLGWNCRRNSAQAVRDAMIAMHKDFAG